MIKGYAQTGEKITQEKLLENNNKDVITGGSSTCQ